MPACTTARTKPSTSIWRPSRSTNLRVDAAGRYEHYSDFGSATVGKLTARYDLTPEFALRGTVSNGFRAPTLAEEYYSATNVTTNTAQVQLPPDSAGGKLLGLGNGLQPEHSVNLSLGLVWRPLPGVNATLDIYQISITNRIVGTGDLYGTINGVLQPSAPAVNAAIAANGNSLDPDVVASGTTGVAIFSNGIDTRTQGADLVFNFPVDYAFGHVDWSVGAQLNETVITKIPAHAAGAGRTVTVQRRGAVRSEHGQSQVRPQSWCAVDLRQGFGQSRREDLWSGLRMGER